MLSIRMVVEVYRLTGFQRDLLYAIAGFERPSGQLVKDELEDYFGRDITHGQLYPNLDTLVESELVNKGQIDRRTNFYDLSSSGRDVLTSRREWEDQHLESIISVSV